MKKIIILVILSMLILTGCGTKTEQKKGVENINIGYENGADTSPMWMASKHEFAASESGYYYMESMQLKFFDIKQQIAYPVCGKAECNHSVHDENCDSYFEASGSKVWYYNHNIYLLSYENQNCILMRVSPDGSTREKLFSIGSTSGSGQIYEMIFHDNCAYVYNVQGGIAQKEEYTATIHKFSLDGKNDDIIYSYTAKGAIIENVKSYGEKLMFIVEEVTFDGTKSSIGGKGVYAYDYKSGNTELIIDDAVTDYSLNVKNNELYYFVYNDGLYLSKLDSLQDTKKILWKAPEDNLYSFVSFDGDNIYLSNSRWYTLSNCKYKIALWILGIDGQEKKKISDIDAYFGDGNYMFARTSKRDAIQVIKSEDILSKDEWTTIE